MNTCPYCRENLSVVKKEGNFIFNQNFFEIATFIVEKWSLETRLILKRDILSWNTYSHSIIADFIRKLKSYLFILLIDKIQKKEIDTSIYSKYWDLYECFHSSFHEKLCISALASTENITFYPVECANTLNLMTELRFNCMNLTIMNIVNEYYTITNQVNLEPINQRIELVNNNMKNIFTTIDLAVYNPLLTMLISVDEKKLTFIQYSLLFKHIYPLYVKNEFDENFFLINYLVANIITGDLDYHIKETDGEKMYKILKDDSKFLDKYRNDFRNHLVRRYYLNEQILSQIIKKVQKKRKMRLIDLYQFFKKENPEQKLVNFACFRDQVIIDIIRKCNSLEYQSKAMKLCEFIVWKKQYNKDYS